MKLGRNLARTFLDYYKLQNYIIFKPSTVTIKNSDSSMNMDLHPPPSSTTPLRAKKMSSERPSAERSSSKIAENLQTEEIQTAREAKSSHTERMFSLDDG
jgi:hypothetical protein